MIWVQLVYGLLKGGMHFLIAPGLTISFGVSRIVNFARGLLMPPKSPLDEQPAPYTIRRRADRVIVVGRGRSLWQGAVECLGQKPEIARKYLMVQRAGRA